MQENGRGLNAPIEEKALYYRSLVPSDLEALRAAHQALFPIDYEDKFYHAAVRGEQGIVSIAAVYRIGPKEELAGFLTARVCCLRECDTTDRVLLGLSSSLVDAYNALYILTVGVLEPVRHRGIGSKLLAAILEQAKERCCSSVYLHVIEYNAAAIAFYKRNRFQEIALLHNFYFIGSGRQLNPKQFRYNAYLYALPLELSDASPFQLWACFDILVSSLRRLLARISRTIPGTFWNVRQLRCFGAMQMPDIEMGMDRV
ncbi:probable N-alpha-acetyltransferase 50 [Coccomyxa sp. Obi]|nr:probable N-alpha-acetyltransferase 50 [Coccomyxa sp. Obi]